jgi:nicotinamidase-related amidase
LPARHQRHRPWGIATPFGVESTVRAAFEHGYAVIIAEDATSISAEMHAFSITEIMARIAIVSRSAEIAFERR